MNGINIPIGGDMAPFIAMAAELRTAMRKMTANVKGDTKQVSSSARLAASGFRFLRTSAVNSFRVIGQAARRLGSMMRGVFRLIMPGGLLLSIAGLVGGFLSLRGVMRGFKDAFDMGGALSDLSARTGAAVSDLAILGEAFKQNGLSADQVGSSINRLQRALAGANEDGEDTSGVFSKLGLDMRALRKMNPTQQFDAIGKAIASIEDPAERAAAAMAIFGRSGGELITLFRDGKAIGNAAQNLGKQAHLLQKNAALFDRISDILGSAGNKLKGFFVGLADRFAPTLLPLLEAFDRLDFASFGQALGESIRALMPTTERIVQMFAKAREIAKNIGTIVLGIFALIQNGRLREFMEKSMTLAIEGALDLLWRGFKSAAAMLASALAAIFNRLKSLFTDPMMKAAMIMLFRGLGQIIAGEIKMAISNLPGMGDLFHEGDTDVALGRGRIEGAGENLSWALENQESMGKFLVNMLEDMGIAGKEAFGETGAGVKEAAAAFQKMIDEVKDQVDAIRGKFDSTEEGEENNFFPTEELGESIAKNVGQVMTLTTGLGRVGGGGFGATFFPMVSQQQQTNKHLIDIKRNTTGLGNATAIV
jgi:hypothetical protein